ncbi:DUF5320 domain-containing protein [Clostridia bacterium]|nr:DUF5320 domain-containing protein [Clostridia bacterium]
MPARDGSGPRGMGSMTGRGLGYCNTARPTYGVGRGQRMGFGRGYRQSGYSALSLEEERSWLKSRLDAIDNEVGESEEK